MFSGYPLTLGTDVPHDTPTGIGFTAYPIANPDIHDLAWGKLTGVPATFPSTPHALLDASVDNDTVASAPVRGGLILANSTPKWGQLALGGTGTIPRSNGSDLAYSTVTYVDAYTKGAIPYASLANVLSALAIGTAGQKLIVDPTNLIPSWVTDDGWVPTNDGVELRKRNHNHSSGGRNLNLCERRQNPLNPIIHSKILQRHSRRRHASNHNRRNRLHIS